MRGRGRAVSPPRACGRPSGGACLRAQGGVGVSWAWGSPAARLEGDGGADAELRVQLPPHRAEQQQRPRARLADEVHLLGRQEHAQDVGVLAGPQAARLPDAVALARQLGVQLPGEGGEVAAHLRRGCVRGGRSLRRQAAVEEESGRDCLGRLLAPLSEVTSSPIDRAGPPGTMSGREESGECLRSVSEASRPPAGRGRRPSPTAAAPRPPCRTGC